MDEIIIYCRIKNFETDDGGETTAGLKINTGYRVSPPIDYKETFIDKEINMKGFCDVFGLTAIGIDYRTVEIITKEQYETEFGDDDADTGLPGQLRMDGCHEEAGAHDKAQEKCGRFFVDDCGQGFTAPSCKDKDGDDYTPFVKCEGNVSKCSQKPRSQLCVDDSRYGHDGVNTKPRKEE